MTDVIAALNATIAAIVLGAATFTAGMVGEAIAIPLGARLARANGVYLFP